MTRRLLAGLVGLLLAAATLTPTPAEARSRAHCGAWIYGHGQPIACRAHSSVRPSDWWWFHR